MLATYHNHTSWSDGKNSIAALIDHAARTGIDELGISDHYVMHPSGRQPGWSMKHDDLPRYVEEILSHTEAASKRGVTVRLGLEVDWFPGHAEAIRRKLDPYPFDYLIGSVHDIGGFAIDSSPAPWEKIDTDGINEVYRQYWLNIQGLAESGLVDVIAHIDLPKKFGYYPTRRPEKEIRSALDAIAESGAVVELNTAGWHKPCADAYPTLDILKACREREIPTTLSADAHQPDHLLRDFEKAAERLKEAGFTDVARFAEREMHLEPIDAGVPGAVNRA